MFYIKVEIGLIKQDDMKFLREIFGFFIQNYIRTFSQLGVDYPVKRAILDRVAEKSVK